MRHLPLPVDSAGRPYGAGAVFRLCVGGIAQPQDLIRRMNGIAIQVQDAEDEYNQKAAMATLHEFPRANQVNGLNGVVTADELKQLYIYRMVNTGQPGRAIYDRLIISSGEKCPLCGVNTVSTLDHHLPKADYPVLSVAATNLVPACRDCQSAKMQTYPRSASDQTLHPYFDDIDGDIWLSAVVSETQPTSFTFGVSPPNTWTTIMAKRVRNHFDSFDLQRLYSINAANELTGVRPILSTLLNAGGPMAVREELNARADGWLNGGANTGRQNSWQLAMYRAAGANNWFCEGGFALTG